MDGDAQRQAVEIAGPFALAIGFAAGLAFSFNPVALAAIPVALAYVIKARKSEQALILGTAFVAGMLPIHVLLGAFAELWGTSPCVQCRSLCPARQQINLEPFSAVAR